MSKLKIVVNDFKIVNPHYSKPIKNWDEIITNIPKGKRAIRRQNAAIAKQKAGR